MELFNSLLYMLGAMAPYILLGFLIAGVMHSFIPQRTLARHLSGSGLREVVKAALIGVPLPLCSCGVLPTAIAMRRGGASRAASTSFLLATPQTGVDSIAATWSLLGPAFAVVRPLAALVTAVAGGLAVGRGESADETVAEVAADAEERGGSFVAKCMAALRYGFVDLPGSIGGWLVTGLVIAAVITVYVPDDAFTVLGDYPFLSMLTVLVIAVPMYVCATGSIPIAMSLVMKGLSPGAAFVLLMAGPAVNFASYALVSREMGRRAAMMYIASVVAGALVFGLAIDYVFPGEWFAVSPAVSCCGDEHGMGLFTMVCAAVLAVLLLYAFVSGKFKHNHLKVNDMTKEYDVKGMNCPHCQAAVTKSISAVAGVEKVEVSLSDGVARVAGTQSDDDVVAAVRAAGFDASRRRSDDGCCCRR